MSSYSPKLLRVDLSTGTLTEETVPEETAAAYIGGRGLAAKYLYDELSPHTDPLSADNKLILTIGPLAGTGGLSLSRWLATTKSPLTDGYFRSAGGGDFGAWLSFAGLQMLIIEGKATKPCYLYLEDGRREIRDAGELWGKGTVQTQERLREIHGKQIRVACIGPAGEKLVRYASIMSDARSASRGGVGTVMGAKNLKAVVIRATSNARPSDEFKDLISQQIAAFRSARAFRSYAETGTTGSLRLFLNMGVFPVRNFREGRFEGWEKLRAEEYGKLKLKDVGCYGCMINCGKIRLVKDGPYAGARNEGPEYESIWAFTGPIACSDIGFTIAADALCDDLGMDTISTGNSIGFAYELFEKGIIGTGDTDGLELRYGDPEPAFELIKRIGDRQGFGATLAEGTKRAGTLIGKGAEACAMHAKGLEFPAYEPRAAKRHGLGYVTSNIGASHTLGYCDQELFNVPVPRPLFRFAEEGGSDVLKHNQDRTAVNETGVGCLFAWGLYPFRLFGSMLVSATGVGEFGDRRYLGMVGERIYNLERAFNIREGFGRKDDLFPERITTEPLRNAGPAEGQIIRRPVALLDEYYRVRGWDRDGVPTPEKLTELGLEGVAQVFKAKVENRTH